MLEYEASPRHGDGGVDGEADGSKGTDELGEHGQGIIVGKRRKMEVVMDLEFGKCKLQVQVPERGSITEPRQLVGKEVVTSFEWLTERYFARLEAEEEGDKGGAVANGTDGIGESREDSIEPGRRKLRTEIDYVGGSVEIACSLGGADGVVDLVGAYLLLFLLSHFLLHIHSSPSPRPPSNPPVLTHLPLLSSLPSSPKPKPSTTPLTPRPESGETMRAAGLLPISTLVHSTAVLLSSTHPSNPPLVALIASRIKGVITAQRYVLCQYNIPRRLLAEATKITPGRRAPTVTALDRERGGEERERGGEERGEERGREEWVAVSSMVVKKEVAGAMDRLTEVGATDILVLGIENSRTG